MIVKKSQFKNNSRTSLKKWIFSITFPVPKKKSEQFKEFQNHWTPWNSLYGITCTPLPPPPQLYVLHPPTKGSLQLFKKFHALSPPPPANKSKVEIFQSPISIEGVYTMHLMLPIYVEYFWSSSLLSCNKDSEGFSK